MNTSVEQLITIGAALRQALQQQDWTAIGTLDQQCRQAVEDALHEPQPDEGLFKAKLQELLEVYRELVVFCQAEQQRLATELVQFNQSRQGAKVYQLFG